MKIDYEILQGSSIVKSGQRALSSSVLGLIFWLAGTVAAVPAWSAEPRTEHTYKLEDGEVRPAATLEDAQWLVGSWHGSAFGQQFEEVWNPASAGSMVGLFKLYGDAGVEFYEIMELSVDEGTLSLKVKHFSADFVAWEEPEDYVNFQLVKMEPDALHFSGISFYRRSRDHIDAYIVMKEKGGIKEYPLVYRRD